MRTRAARGKRRAIRAGDKEDAARSRRERAVRRRDKTAPRSRATTSGRANSRRPFDTESERRTSAFARTPNMSTIANTFAGFLAARECPTANTQLPPADTKRARENKAARWGSRGARKTFGNSGPNFARREEFRQ